MKKSIQNFLMVLLLTLLVAASGLLIILGSNFYTQLNQSIEQQLSKTSALLYFNQRFKQQDYIDGFELQNQMLILNHEGYVTMVYECEGYLVEQVSDQAFVDPLAAAKIAPLHALSFRQDGQQITVSFTDERGQHLSQVYTVLSEEEAP